MIFQKTLNTLAIPMAASLSNERWHHGYYVMAIFWFVIAVFHCVLFVEAILKDRKVNK